MSSLTSRFVVWMHKRATSDQGETISDFEVSSDKCPKRSGLNEKVQNSPIVITSDSPERTSSALPTLEGAAQDSSREACAISLEDGTLVGDLPTLIKLWVRLPLYKQPLVHRFWLDGPTS